MSNRASAVEFPPASRENWRKRVEAVLKGGDFAARLMSSTDDGIAVEPFYHQVEGPRAERRHDAPWTVVQRADYPDASRANAQALDELANGTGGLALSFQGAGAARGFGLTRHDARAIGAALADVRLDLVSISFEPGPHGRRVAQAFSEWIANEPYDPERIDVCFGMDPVGALASRGDLARPWPEVARSMAELVGALREQGFRGP